LYKTKNIVGVNLMDKSLKIVLSGLDYAGKTSILTALDKKFDFEKYIAQLKPTIKVEYNKRNFLGYTIYIWDMGGQERYLHMGYGGSRTLPSII